MHYKAKHLEFLRRGYVAMMIPALTQAFNARFRCNLTEGQILAATKNHGIKSGRDCRFIKGHQPWNSATKGQGLTGANIHSFKKGNVPANRNPLWTERIDSKDGFILIKIPERNPHTGHPTRYKHKHVWMWEQKHGPRPDGMIVAFRDGDRQNCDTNNLMLISRAELLRLNQRGYKSIPDELKPSLLALTKLEVKTFEKMKDADCKEAAS